MTAYNKALTEQFLTRLSNKRVPMHSFILYQDGTILDEWYKEGADSNTLHRMFSITKSLTAIAIGALAADHKLCITDKICDYFPEYVDEHTHPYIQAMTIRDCLMMRTCHASTTYKVCLNNDWVESFFKVPPTHRPGTIFHYDTSSAHVLAALVEKLSGMELIDYVRYRLPEMGISQNATIKKDPFGVSMGGSGLCATSRDMLGFGAFLMNKVNSSDTDELTLFVKDACANLTPNYVPAPLPSEACGYGYMIWQNERGGFVLYGMGGQLVIVLPQINLIAVTTADTQGIQGGNQNIYDAFYDIILPAFDVNKICENVYPVTATPKAGLIDLVNHKKYSFDSDKLAWLQINFDEPSLSTKGSLDYVLNGQNCSIAFGSMDKPQSGLFPGINQYCEATGLWIATDCLDIKVSINDEAVGSIHIQIFFEQDGHITIFMKKVLEDMCDEYQGHFCSIR